VTVKSYIIIIVLHGYFSYIYFMDASRMAMQYHTCVCYGDITVFT